MTEEHVEFVSVFLAYKGETSEQARFQFTLIDPVGVRTTVFADDANGSRFEGYDDHWGKHNCLRRSELSVICPEGEFAIEVGMTLPHHPQQAHNKPTVPPSSDEDDSTGASAAFLGMRLAFERSCFNTSTCPWRA